MLFLVVDIYALPFVHPQCYSKINKAIFGSAQQRTNVRQVTFIYVRSQDALHAYNGNLNYLVLNNLGGDLSDFVEVIYFPVTQRQSSYFAPTIEHSSGSMFISTILANDTCTRTEANYVHDRVLSDLVSMGMEPDKAYLNTPLVRRNARVPGYIAVVQYQRVLWLGYLHNILAILIVLALGYSLCSFPEWGRWIGTNRKRQARALARNQCPACGYDITGLPKPICPECGSRLTPAEQA
jgi:hypothetical protein